MDSSQDHSELAEVSLPPLNEHMGDLTPHLVTSVKYKTVGIFPVKVNCEVHRASEKVLRAFNSPKLLLETHDGQEHSRYLYVPFLAAKASLFGGRSDKEDPAALNTVKSFLAKNIIHPLVGKTPSSTVPSYFTIQKCHLFPIAAVNITLLSYIILRQLLVYSKSPAKSSFSG